MITKCPECQKEISSSAESCPHCGFKLNKSNASMPATFQLISIGAVAIALFTPKILSFIPLLAAFICSIIALIRKEPRWFLSLLILIFSFWLTFSVSSDLSNIGGHNIKPQTNPFSIKVTRFTNDDYGYYKVIGYISNNGKDSYNFVLLRANFYDRSGALSGTDTTYACGNDHIQPGGKKSFEFMGTNPGDYKRVSVELESFR